MVALFAYLITIGFILLFILPPKYMQAYYAITNLAVCFGVIYYEWYWYGFVVIWNYSLFSYHAYRFWLGDER